MNQLSFYLPIEKKDPKEHMVWGYASTEALDSQGEIVKSSAMKAAIADYMKFANVREMHQPKAVGKTKSVTHDEKGTYIGVKVVDRDAWEKVVEGVYNGFSVGGRVNTMVDNEITDLALSEISLVDRPANPEAVFSVFKRDFSTQQRRDLASSGKAMPDGSYPIENTTDLENAIKSWGRGGAKASVKAHIVRRAKALGAADKLPADWTKMDKGTGDAMTLTSHIQNLERMRDNEASENDEPTTQALNAAITHLRSAASSELLEDDADDKGDANEMYRSDDPKGLLKAVDAKIQKGEMPSKDEIDAMLKAQGIEVNQKTESVMEFEMAGLIVKAVEANMQKVQNLDLLKKEANIVLNKADVEVAETVKEKKEFKKIMDMVSKAESLIKTQNDSGNVYELSDEDTTGKEETTQNAARSAENNRGKPKGDWASALGDDAAENEYALSAATGLQQAYESHMATDGNPAQSLALAALDQVVAMLNARGLSGALSVTELDALENGVKAGSEMTSMNQTSVPQAGNAVSAAAQTTNLKKFESTWMKKFEDLEKKYEELAKQPVPVKAKASFQTVEKVEKSEDEEKVVSLAKAIDRANELNKLMSANPNNTAYIEEAIALSPQIMKLQREVRVQS